jgi:hypothetical protein
MAGWTNKGKYKVLGWALRGETIPDNFYVALVTSAVAPTADLNTFTELTEIAVTNGYTTGGYELTPNSTDFDVWTEDDGSDLALIEIKDIVWTASGGTIPASGDGARYAVLTDNNASVAAREVYYYWDLTSNRSVSDTQTLTLQDTTIRITES